MSTWISLTSIPVTVLMDIILMVGGDKLRKFEWIWKWKFRLCIEAYIHIYIVELLLWMTLVNLPNNRRNTVHTHILYSSTRKNKNWIAVNKVLWLFIDWLISTKEYFFFFVTRTFKTSSELSILRYEEQKTIHEKFVSCRNFSKYFRSVRRREGVFFLFFFL